MMNHFVNVGKMVGTLIVAALAITGCSTAPVPITRTVHVEHTRYLPIPPALLNPCNRADLSAIRTNGDLLSALLTDDAALAGCNVQIREIGTLKAPVPATAK